MATANGKGVPHKLNTSVNHLAALLKNLPESLPLDPPQSSYHFSLDEDDVSQEGVAYTFNRRLEIAFEVHSLPPSGQLPIKEQGQWWQENFEK